MRLEIETAQEYTGVMGLNKVSRHAARAFGQTRFARAVKSCNVTLNRSANQTRICCLSKSNRNPCGGPRLEVLGEMDMVPVQISRVIINVETLSSAEMAQTSSVWYRTLNLNCCTCFAQNFNKVNSQHEEFKG